MKNTDFEKILREWKEFRDYLEKNEDPLQLVIDFFKPRACVDVQTDPWDSSTWPDPWELIQEKRYCEFYIILGICYTLQLTDRFKDSLFSIQICKSLENFEIHYLLVIDNSYVIGFDKDTYISKEELPACLHTEQVYNMPKL